MPTLKTPVLEIAYQVEGPEDGSPVVLLHGFPYDIRSYTEVSARLAGSGHRVFVPWLRGYGPTRFLDPDTPRSGEQAALGADLLAFLDALGLEKAVVGGYDWGGRAACVVAALWPERVSGLVTCGAGYNIQNIARSIDPAAPEEEYLYWYQYYFHSERGRAGLEKDRNAFCRLLWRLWSPTWAFTDAMFEHTAASFANPDFVDVVIHSYRHRFGLVMGDPQCREIEERLAEQPAITVPTRILQGIDDGVDPPRDGDPLLLKFTGPMARRLLPGVGHNLPQEAPAAFAAAVAELSGVQKTG